MIGKISLARIAVVACVCSAMSAPALEAKDNWLAPWASAPARSWPQETYPIGNGRLGAMPFGDLDQEHIQFNEDSLWVGDEQVTGAYQNLGDIFIQLGHKNAKEYRRELDISNAIQTITYTFNGVAYKREYFASHPADVMVFKFTADKKGAYDAVITLKDAHTAKTKVENGNTLVIAGTPEGARYKADKKKTYKIVLDYEARVMVLNEGGQMTSDGGSVTIKGADAFTILVDAGTDFTRDRSKGWKGKHPHEKIVERLAAAAKTPYGKLRSAHVADYKSLFDRMTVYWGSTAPELLAKPLTERQDAYKKGSKDPDLERLMVQFARYLMISSSRQGCQPANLQGLWNNSNSPPWRCDYHSDVNLEMNYWFVDMANLSDCFQPFSDWLNSINPVRVAETKKAFNARGWLMHGENGLFGGSTWKWSKGDSSWLMQNMFDHYLYTMDKVFLKKDVYPIMKSLCEFWVDNLKKLPDGTLVSPNGYSPEHGPDEDGVSFDQQLVWNLFDDYAKTAKILDVDKDFRAKVADMQKHLLGPKIGKWGQLQEWMVDRDNPKDKHRHLSHMIAVHPGHQISPRTTSKLAEAAKVSMNARGDGATGWSKAWKICIWSRLHDGDRAYKLFGEFLKCNVYPSLLGFHPPFQIDCNFGSAAGVLEMLVQSQMGYIEILPALPSAWTEGKATGVKARGAFVLDIEWKNGELTKATATSQKGTLCRIYSEKPLKITSGGKPVTTKRDGNIISFPTKPKAVYTITP
jgi:alpha-L-fucosidase 2